MALNQYRISLCYAKILFKMTAKAKSLSLEEAFKDEGLKKFIEAFSNFLATKKHHYIFLALAKLSYDKVSSIVTKVLNSFQVEQIFIDFAKFVIDHGRIYLMHDIIKVAKSIVLETSNTAECLIFISHPKENLPQNFQKEIEHLFAKKIGKNITTKYFIKKELILGYRIMSPNILLECTLARCLQKVSLNLNRRMSYEK